ncbi:hypothetical protein [Modicisalibacter coralii]|uniref:hypothetical protein n=1 Tax=Modicisalibacter coralii TaxID=2304602 RepID=UPI00100B8D17|nr:hypothetical protein [Halomonas coralii]
MLNYGLEAARIDPHLMAPYTTLRLGDGTTWRVRHRENVILLPSDARRRRLRRSGLPASALWWDARGIRNAREHWYWQPEVSGETAPWLETIHRSWPYHPPGWLLDADLVVLHGNAFAREKTRRQHQQRALIRFWRYRRTPLLYLAIDGRDAWHMQRLTSER